MRVKSTYWVAVTGSSTASITISLNPAKSYLVTGGLILKEGSNHARVYIGTVCTSSGDVILCGIRDIDGDAGLGVTEILTDTVRVTIKLRTTGGKHRAEGVIYEL